MHRSHTWWSGEPKDNVYLKNVHVLPESLASKGVEPIYLTVSSNHSPQSFPAVLSSTLLFWVLLHSDSSPVPLCFFNSIVEKHAESFKRAFVRWSFFTNNSAKGHKSALTLRLPVLFLSLLCYLLDGTRTKLLSLLISMQKINCPIIRNSLIMKVTN